MANGGRHSGGGRNVTFRLKTDHSGIVKADGTTAATAEADALLILQKENHAGVGGTGITFDESGVPTVKVTHYKDDEAFETALNIMCPKVAGASSTSVTTIKLEDGSSIYESGSSSGTPLINISYSSKGDDGKIKVFAVVCNAKMSSGSQEWKGGEAVSPTLEYAGITASADITIPKALLCANIIDTETATDIVIPKN